MTFASVALALLLVLFVANAPATIAFSTLQDCSFQHVRSSTTSGTSSKTWTLLRQKSISHSGRSRWASSCRTRGNILCLTGSKLTLGAAASSSSSSSSSAEAEEADTTSIEYLKSELAAYLKKRNEVNADEAAKSEVGKVIGGTKGNKILEYVSGAPNKEKVIDELPNIFDYDELTKYGFGHLVTPIMNAGGRREMYTLMGLPPPPIPDRVKPKPPRKVVIDRTGESEKGRYSGLKMGQVLDDDAMARALDEAQRKKREKQLLRPKMGDEDYVMPFADKRNTGPKMTPDWTPEKIDEEGRRRGRALAWARKAKAGEYKKDPEEILAVEGALRAYCIFTVLLTSFAFGKSTPMALSMLGFANGNEETIRNLIDTLQAPALAAIATAIGSGVVSAFILAPAKKRNSFVWAVKGLAGGPLAIRKLRELDELQVRGEE